MATGGDMGLEKSVDIIWGKHLLLYQNDQSLCIYIGSGCQSTEQCIGLREVFIR